MATRKEVMRRLKPKTKDLIAPITQEYLERYNIQTMADIDEVFSVIWRGFNKQCQILEGYVKIIDKECLYPTGEVDVIEILDSYFDLCENLTNCDFGLIAIQLYREDDICGHNKFAQDMAEDYALALNKLQDDFPHVEYIYLIRACDKYTLTCNSLMKKYWTMHMDELTGAVNEPFLEVQHKMHKVARKHGLIGYDENNLPSIEEEVVTDSGEVFVKKILDRKELQQRVRECGYTFKSQCGSHRKYEDNNGRVVIVPIHSKDIGRGLSNKIQKEIQK